MTTHTIKDTIYSEVQRPKRWAVSAAQRQAINLRMIGVEASIPQSRTLVRVTPKMSRKTALKMARKNPRKLAQEIDRELGVFDNG